MSARRVGRRAGAGRGRSTRSAFGVAVLAVTLGGCGVPLSNQPVRVADPGQASTTIDRLVDPAMPVRIYFLRNGRFSSVERRDTASSAAHPEIAIRNTMESLKAGLLPREADQGFTSPLGEIVADTDFDFSVDVSEGAADIDLSNATAVLRGLAPEQRRTLIAQLALTTLLATPGIGAVRFVVDGTPSVLSSASGQIGPDFHVGDFPCLDDGPTCELPDLLLPDETVDSVPVEPSSGPVS